MRNGLQRGGGQVPFPFPSSECNKCLSTFALHLTISRRGGRHSSSSKSSPFVVWAAFYESLYGHQTIITARSSLRSSPVHHPSIRWFIHSFVISCKWGEGRQPDSASRPEHRCCEMMMMGAPTGQRKEEIVNRLRSESVAEFVCHSFWFVDVRWIQIQTFINNQPPPRPIP